MSHNLYYLTQTLAEVPESDDWLGEGELRRIAGMRFPKRRDEWRLGRWTVKHAICAYRPGIAPRLSLLEIRAAEDGAPEAFLGCEPARVSISISHSHGMCLSTVGPIDLAVGCDLELVEPRDDGFVEDYFTPEEQVFMEQVQRQDRALAATLIWSAKECTLKVLRQGLRRDTRSVLAGVEFDSCGDAWRPWTGRCLESSRIFHGWWRICDSYVHTVAADRPTAPPTALCIAA